MNPLGSLRRRRAEKLCRQAREHLDQLEYERALELAAKIEELRYSGAFEIAALARQGMGDLEQAVEVLERGNSLAPTVWSNWQLLGNLRSDLGRYEAAAAAYEEALRCPSVWEASVRLNQAVLAARTGRHEEALGLLEGISDPEIALRAKAARVTSLLHLERLGEAAALAEEMLAGEGEDDESLEVLASVAADLGRIRLRQGSPAEDARRLATDWLEAVPSSSELLALVRVADGLRSPSARRFRLVLHARHPPAGEEYAQAAGFYASFQVIADDAEEALRLLRKLESDGSLDLVDVQTCETLDAQPGELKGVLWRSGRVYYLEKE